MSKFKVGDKIYANKLGMWGVVDFVCHAGITADMENKKNETFNYDEVENFIEQKYKIGTVVEMFPSLGKAHHCAGEIVKASLNKKLKQYSYLIFAKDDGYIIAQNESEIVPIVNKKIINFTPKEVEIKMNDILRNMGKDFIIKIK